MTGIGLFKLMAHEMAHMATPRLLEASITFDPGTAPPGTPDPRAVRLAEVHPDWEAKFGRSVPRDAMEYITDCIAQAWLDPFLQRYGMGHELASTSAGGYSYPPCTTTSDALGYLE